MDREKYFNLMLKIGDLKEDYGLFIHCVIICTNKKEIHT